MPINSGNITNPKYKTYKKPEIRNCDVEFLADSEVSAPKEQPYKKPGILACVCGFLAGYAVLDKLKIISDNLVISKIFPKIKDLSNLSQNEVSTVTKALESILHDTGLSKKGVSILKVTDKNTEEISKMILKDISENKIKEAKIECDKILSNIKNGNNATYKDKIKKILLPEKGLLLGAPHEIGHALNNLSSIIGKLLQNFRNSSDLALPIAIIALLKIKKAPDEESNDVIDQITDFIKNNAGKLTFLTFVPFLAEEALASIKGNNNFVKKVSDTSLLNKASKINKLSFFNYLLPALAASIGIALGVKVKDAIAKPKPIKPKD